MTASSDLENAEQIARRRIRDRFWRALDYLSLFAYIFVVYTGAVVLDFLLFSVIQFLLQSDIAQYPFVALWFERVKIGLALLLLLAAFIHGVFSTVSQIRFDIDTAKGEE
ncbi:MAG: hypothetical protein HY782_00185 [Chloroflexi bacterium]|nr:hypothetical protein [Chloroflexota bacterium]